IGHGVIVTLVGDVPYDAPDGRWIVLELSLDEIEAEIEVRAAATDGVRVVELVVAHAKIDVEIPDDAVAAVLDGAERRRHRDIVAFGDLVAQEIGRIGS